SCGPTCNTSSTRRPGRPAPDNLGTDRLGWPPPCRPLLCLARALALRAGTATAFNPPQTAFPLPSSEGEGRGKSERRWTMKQKSRLTVEALESRDLLTTLSLTPLVQVSGLSPFAGSTADHIASQPGTVTLNSEGEPYVAVNPTNPKNVVSVWQQ